MDKFCQKCGSKIPPGSGFCLSCGTPVPPDKTEALPAPDIRRVIFPLYIFIPVLGILLVGAILVSLFVMWGKPGAGGTSANANPGTNKPATEISAHEVTVINALKTLARCEDRWHQSDNDRNNLSDYWTYDISAFYRKLQDNGQPLAYIELDLARADAEPHPDRLFGPDFSQDFGDNPPEPKDGYLFKAMIQDENGQAYNHNEVNGTQAANDNKFAFVAYPAEYGVTGKRTFIINENRRIYAVDTGSEANKIVRQWPGTDPTTVKAPGGQRWSVVEK